jgi:hypothetical protein
MNLDNSRTWTQFSGNKINANMFDHSWMHNGILIHGKFRFLTETVEGRGHEQVM